MLFLIFLQQVSTHEVMGQNLVSHHACCKEWVFFVFRRIVVSKYQQFIFRRQLLKNLPQLKVVFSNAPSPVVF